MRKKMPGGGQERPVGKKVDWNALKVVHPDAAGIDVAAGSTGRAISPERDEQPVRSRGCFTADLPEMMSWRAEKRVRSVALQSTGVYWMRVLPGSVSW
jgi:hypothetical protein